MFSRAALSALARVFSFKAYGTEGIDEMSQYSQTNQGSLACLGVLRSGWIRKRVGGEGIVPGL